MARGNEVGSSRSPREVVSWNGFHSVIAVFFSRRPLREVVSWNPFGGVLMPSKYVVDLFVRSWVEICSYVHTECVWRVDLLVRSWVEILFQHYYHFYGYGRPFCEVVSWNDEYCAKMNEASGRPLREVVSWNVIVWRCTSIFCVSTSLWGRELK